MNDDKIDLTIDKKFCTRKRILFYNNDRLPWKPNIIMKPTQIRSYGDRLSDDYGGTIRRTSNNRIWVLQPEGNYWKQVLDELLYESCLIRSAVKTCVCCGKLHITKKIVEPICNHCESSFHDREIKEKFFRQKLPDKKRIPWEDSSFAFNDIFQLRAHMVNFAK